MNLEYDPRTHTAVITLKNGAIVKIREDEDGDLEIRETTHRYLNVKPQARNSLYLATEDPARAPRLIEYDLPVRQTADLAEELAKSAYWDVPMRPRNLSKAEWVNVRVLARSAEEAISKAITQKPGHTWGTATEVEHP